MPSRHVRASHRHLPVFVEEDHNHALEHILAAAGAKRIPMEGNAIIHFDSHPDMLLPRFALASKLRLLRT